jgi:orotidine-5'-phosphate decarboxylase
MERKVICALDTSDLDSALTTARRLSPHVGAFKIGHALTLAHGIGVVDRFRDVGVERIFLDLKFHDIPNSVAIAVREAAKHGVWMMTLHASGCPAMMTAAVEEARFYAEDQRPLLVGVSVLTSLGEDDLHQHLAVGRSLVDHMTYLSKLAVESGLDGVVCSPNEVVAVRKAIGREGVIVTPGIRLSGSNTHDQRRVGSAGQALHDGANYVVIGRALAESSDPESTLVQLGVHGPKTTA